jgi:feruloyl esterase
MQQVFADGMSANPAIDTDDDRIPDSLVNIETLHEDVLEKCDDIDGIVDGVIDNQRACDFDAAGYLARHRCPDGSPAAGCFTSRQADFILQLYQGSRDAAGKEIYGGLQPGSEMTWHRYIPTEQNRLRPYVLKSLQRTHQLMFDADPALPWAWRAQDPDAVLQESSELQEIMDARDADLRPYLVERGGKLLLYQGWDEPFHSADQLIDFYESIVQTSFSGNRESAASSVKLFMLPGVQHCILGSGPDRWDSYGVMKDWVEKGRVPGKIIVHHETWDVTDNERPVCPYPEQAIYNGPEGGANDPANWVAGNFTCP